MAESNILILGASGQTGFEIVKILSAAGFPVRITYRESSELLRLRNLAFEDFYADYNDAETLKKAMEGCDRVFVIQPVTQNMLTQSTNICEAAKATGVKHLIRISNMVTGPDMASDIAKMHYESDEMLKSLGCSYTIIKGANYYQNMLYSSLTIIRQGHFALPLGTASLSQVDVRDIALVGAHTLIDEGHENKEYTITGPEAITMHVVARRLSKIINKEIRYIPVEPIAATQVFKDQGLPDWSAKSIGEMFMEYGSGKYKYITRDFLDITHTKPRSIDAFFNDYRNSFLRETVTPLGAN